MSHDIIDNRNEKMVDHINRILASTEAARLAVGYFFLSGLTSIAEKLADVKELRLLIGNTTLRRLAERWPSPAEAVSAPLFTYSRPRAK
jgi:hypothetical protein